MNAPQHAAKSSTRDALLEAAIAELRTRPENDFRIEQILHSAQASFSSLYHHFGNREGLITQAQIEIFKSPMIGGISTFLAGIQKVQNFEDLGKVVRAGIDGISAPESLLGRQAQLLILASSLSRPELARAIAKEQTLATEKISGAFLDLQKKGVLKPDIQVRELAQFILSNVVGQIVIDVGAGEFNLEKWRETLYRALMAQFQ